MIRSAVMAFLCALSLPMAALAESIRTVPPSKPAPNNERRIALVIGNSKYKEAPLRNPANDARAISQALSATGFSVTVIEDATQVAMRRAIRTFGDELAKAAVGIFYYAGHGMQVRGANYLIPVNADIEREDEIADQAIDANLVLSKMDSAKNSLNIMILDACRNNPFARSFRSSARGLAQMDAPSGTLISFATAPGSVASDGEGQNGLYTEHLLKAIQQPGLPIEQVFKQVRIGVTRATKDQQIPWESSSLKGDFYFTPGDPAAGATSQQAVQKALQDANRAAEERLAREREEFQKKMEQMVAEALAKQRAMLEAERKAAGVSTAPVAAPTPVAAPAPVMAATPAPAAPAAPQPPAPTQLAAAAPTVAAAPAAPVVPAAMGNRWFYTGTDAFRRDLKHEYLVEVLGATSAGVIETTRHNNGQPKQWVYTGTPTLVGGAGAMVVFSPLVTGTQDLKVGQKWNDVALEQVGACARALCTVAASVSGTEKISTPAGSFDALKVEVEVRLSGTGGAGNQANFTYWVAPQAKHIVKYRSRSSGSGGMSSILAFDAELAGYQLAGGAVVGKIPEFTPVAGGGPQAILVATTAPVAGLLASGPAAPRAGDRWEYLQTDQAGGRKSKRTIEVVRAEGGTIRDRVSGDGVETLEVAHAPGAYLVDAGMMQFSPYLGAFGALEAGKRLSDVEHFRMAYCGGLASCDSTARIAGVEKVSVAAGSYDATKIVIEFRWNRAPQRLSAELTYWYAPAARRIVKATTRVGNLVGNNVTTVRNEEIELVGLQLR